MTTKNSFTTFIVALVAVSSGRNNSYGHPHEAILERLKKYGIFIKMTDNEGDIVVSSNGHSL